MITKTQGYFILAALWAIDSDVCWLHHGTAMNAAVGFPALLALVCTLMGILSWLRSFGTL